MMSDRLSRRGVLTMLTATAALPALAACGSGAAAARAFPVAYSEAEWSRRLTPAQFHILREKGTEPPGSSPLLEEHRQGTFCCAADGHPLFSSRTKYESGTGWPSFWQPLPGAIRTSTDFDAGYPHGHDQFLSMQGASWAVMALSYALEPATRVTPPALPETEPAAVEPWVEPMLFGTVAEVRTLLDGGLSANAATKSGGTTALMMAAPDVDKMRLLLDRGADVNARARSRYSALMVAAQYQEGDAAINLLLDRGAQPYDVAVAELEPLDVLFDEAEGSPIELPETLSRIYGGALVLPESCVYANFVATLDGVVAIPTIRGSNEIVSGGNKADHFLMGLLRALADVVLIGAGVLKDSPRGTWRPEKVYPPAAAAFAELRAALGKPEAPEVAVLTGLGSVAAEHPLFETGAVVLTSDKGADRLTDLPSASTVVVLGDETRFDGRVVVDALRARGHELILSEAGPHVFGSLLGAEVVDELFLTLSPLLAGSGGEGTRLRLVEGADLMPPRELLPRSLRRHGKHLFARYALG